MKNKNKYNKQSIGGESHAVTVNDKFSHIEPIRAQYLEVKVYNNNFDRAFKTFRSLVQRERILSKYKERQFYEKPSDRKRRKKNEAKRKLLEFNDFNKY